MRMLMDTLGRPLKDLRISLIDKCNFRCGYCMPNHKKYHFLPKDKLLSVAEITCFAQAFAELGVHKIRLTGGEPLLRQEVVAIVQNMKAIPGISDVAMTTNGYLLQKLAHALYAAGLDRLTVSLDTIDANLFRYMSGVRASITPVLAGIDAAIAAGFTRLKVNMVVQKGINDHHVVDVCEYFKNKPVQVRFIEYMDVGHSNDWNMDSVYTASEIEEAIGSRFALQKIPSESKSDVATTYRYQDGVGTVGIIASITRPFCKDCVRMRLSAEGMVYTCLFADNGHDVRRWLQQGPNALKERIASIWKVRTDKYSLERHAGNEHATRDQRVEMYKMGG